MPFADRDPRRRRPAPTRRGRAEPLSSAVSILPARSGRGSERRRTRADVSDIAGASPSRATGRRPGRARRRSPPPPLCVVRARGWRPAAGARSAASAPARARTRLRAGDRGPPARRERAGETNAPRARALPHLPTRTARRPPEGRARPSSHRAAAETPASVVACQDDSSLGPRCDDRLVPIVLAVHPLSPRVTSPDLLRPAPIAITLPRPSIAPTALTSPSPGSLDPPSSSPPTPPAAVPFRVEVRNAARATSRASPGTPRGSAADPVVSGRLRAPSRPRARATDNAAPPPTRPRPRGSGRRVASAVAPRTRLAGRVATTAKSRPLGRPAPGPAPLELRRSRWIRMRSHAGGDQLLPDHGLVDDLDVELLGLRVLLAPTSAPQISMSVLAETEDAVVAPAFSHRRWNVGRGIFSPLRGSEIVPVMTTVLPASGASDGDLRRQVLVAHVEVDAALAQPLQLGAQVSRSRCSCEAGRDLRADVLDLLQRLLAGVGDLLQLREPARHSRAAVRLGRHRDREPDQRAPQPDVAAVRRSTRSCGRPRPRRCGRTRAASRASSA